MGNFKRTPPGAPDAGKEKWLMTPRKPSNWRCFEGTGFIPSFCTEQQVLPSAESFGVQWAQEKKKEPDQLSRFWSVRAGDTWAKQFGGGRFEQRDWSCFLGCESGSFGALKGKSKHQTGGTLRQSSPFSPRLHCCWQACICLLVIFSGGIKTERVSKSRPWLCKQPGLEPCDANL